ncbi:hypothetical protein [uncultured Jatrophihabitans sp.]|uniref:hypothetical protein n=1 Tax=uncultured Jatrophihabitans sp. TaxID=1610747 RepID=UPI0035CAF351
MTDPARPYDSLFDTDELETLERISPGSAEFVMGMVRVDMQWQASRQDRLDRWDHSTRVLSIWLTMIVVLGVAGMSAAVIATGHDVAGSVLAGVDLVALANVFVNAWRRA